MRFRPPSPVWITVFVTCWPIVTLAQMPDPKFDARVARPAFNASHPKLIIDKGHFNFYNGGGRYRPLADLAVADGFDVFEGSNPFTLQDLTGAQVLIVADAMASGMVGAPGASDPAFKPAECEAGREWVKAGGGLLLVADHAPMGISMRTMAQRFRVDMSGGICTDPVLSDPALGASTLLFTWKNHGLGLHPITVGRDSTERIHSVETFTGQSLSGPPGSVTLLKVSDRAQDVRMSTTQMHGSSPDSLKRSAAGRAQGLALTYGKGRIVVLADAQMLAAQLV